MLLSISEEKTRFLATEPKSGFCIYLYAPCLLVKDILLIMEFEGHHNTKLSFFKKILDNFNFGENLKV